MDTISTYFSEFGLDFESFLKSFGLIVVGTVLFSAIGRFIFGRRSTLVDAVSSALGILFVYALNIVLYSAGAEFQKFFTPLPFVNFSDDVLTLFHFTGTDYTLICSEILSLIILAFLMNVIDRFIPKGKNIFTWVFFRGVTVFLAMALHLVVTGLFTKFLPEGIVTYAPTILLALLVLLMLTGALKLLVGVLLSTVNPLVGALYTFFFANVVGKQITKAVLTTALLCALVAALNYVGCAVISIAAPALSAYIPFVIVLVLLWYLVNRIF